MNSQHLIKQGHSPGPNVGNWLEIDAAAFESNVRNLLSMIDDRALLCAVVKSHAYGHGADLLLPSLVRLRVPFIGVGNNEEAAIARRCGFEGRILRVRAAAPQEIKAGLDHDIEELVADPQSAWEIHRIAAEAGKTIRIHLDINSSGISRHSLDVASPLGRACAVGIISHPWLQLAGIMTHFPKDDYDHIETALLRFQSQAMTLLHLTGTPREEVLLHCANSYAALHVPGSWLDMVRAGAVLYGDSEPTAGQFQRCLAFKARVASINSYAAGSMVGYGLTHTWDRDSRLASVTAGYGDGYRRALARQGAVLIRGRRAVIVDIVPMNFMVVDVTDIADVSPGDEVVLFGRQGSAEIAPQELETANSAILADLYTVWAQGSRILATMKTCENRHSYRAEGAWRVDSSTEASSMAQGLRIVRLVADREKRGRRLLGVSQLASELDMEQSRVSRLTQELCDLGLLERVERGPFRTGPRFFSLAASLNTGWIRESRTELEALVGSFGLRSRVSVRDGFRVILLRASSNDAVPGSFVKPGMVTPVWCTGSGRALLWDDQQPAVQALLKDVNFIGVGGPGAAHSPQEVSELMDRDRPLGFIVAEEEFEHGVYELAVPVRSPDGAILAALSVLGRGAEIKSSTSDIAKALAAAAERLGSCESRPRENSGRKGLAS